MESYLRRYFWLANAALLVGAAFVSAKAASNALEAAPPSELPTFALDAARVPTVAAAAPWAADDLYRVFGLSRRRLDHDLAENQAPKPSAEPLRVVGTLVANRDEWSLAAILDLETGQVRNCMVGDPIRDATVVAIGRQRVLIRRTSGGVETVESGGGPSALATPRVSSAVTSTTPGSDPWRAIRPSGADRYEVPRAAVSWMLMHPYDNAMRARVIPAFRNGLPVGFTVTSFEPDSVYARLGLASGDVIRRVNGYDLTSVDRMLDLYARLMNAPVFEIELERAGTVLRKTYAVNG